MGFIIFLLLAAIILAIVGLGWKAFFSGVIAGFEKAVDVGTPIIKNLSQEAQEYVNSTEQLRTS